MESSFYKSFVEEAPFGYACHKIVVNDSGEAVDYEFIEVNKAFEDMTGLRSKDIVGRNVSEVLPGIKNDPFDWIRYYGEVALLGRSTSFQRYFAPLKRWYEVKAYSPQAGYFNTALLDITATMETVERLKISEARYRGLVESENIMIVRVDRENRLTFVNEKYCQTFGKTKEALIGHSFVTLVHEQDRHPTLEAMEKLKIPPHHCQLEQRAYTVDGWRWIHWEDHATVDDDGHIVEVQGVGRDITDVKEREALLARKNFELESLLAHVPAVIYVYRLVDGVPDLTYINENLKGVLGYDPERFLHNFPNWMACLHPDDEPGLRQERLERLGDQEAGVIWRGEYRFRDAAGNYRWLSDRQTSVRAPDGSLAFVGVWIDLTERVENERNLKLQQERLAKAQRFTKTGLWEYHMPTGRLYWSKECEALFGLEEGEFEGTYEAFVERVHPDDRDFVLRENAPIVDLRNGKTLQYEHRILRKDGTTLWVRETAGVSNDAQGQPERIIGFVVDITAQRAVEQALENEGKFRQIVENFEGVFWLRDAVEHRLLYISPNFEKLFGLKAEAIYRDIEAPMENIFQEDKVAVRKALRVFRETGILQMEFRYCLPDGGLRWIKTKGFPIKNAEGEVLRYAGFATDVTLMKKSEAALMKAKEKAEESDRIKSAFLATMNHELRTPLNHIIGLSQILGFIVDDQEARDFSGIIFESGNDLLDMIEDILELAMAEEGGVRVKNEWFSGVDLLESSRNALEDTILANRKEKRLRVVVNPCTKVLKSELFLDRGKLKQILHNLFKNAVKFTEEGSIEFGFYQEAEGSLTVYVKDEGIGISEEKQGIIFDFFRQADESLSRKFEGMGIGLAISERLAKVMKAKLWVESKEGEGAVFFIQIPDAVKGPLQEAGREDVSEVPNLADYTIMTVEDDAISRLVVESLLKPTGAKTLHAGDGREALELLQEHPGVHLILMDLHMPEMDDFEAIRLMKEKWKGIPIIALTAYTLRAFRERALEAGCDEVIAKPVRGDFLHKVVEHHLRKLRDADNCPPCSTP
jgi:PAS domain S-box-containing protein